MNRNLFLAALTACTLSVQAQTPPKAGAVQMPGDNGKLAIPYQLGKKGEELVFTLEKAEFASRAFHERNGLFPKIGRRMLVITYAVQNPGKADRPFSNQSYSFTVVSPDDENFVCDGIAANGIAALHPDRRDQLSMQLKPAQKVRAIAVIEMHPKGPVNKLIVQRGKGTPVLRYDLKEKVKPLTGVFAENAGLDMREVGAGALTLPCDVGPWDITVEKCADEPLPIGAYAPDKGKKFVVLTVSIKNASMTPYPLHSSLILTKVIDADGGDLPESRTWVKASSPEAFGEMRIEPGASVRVRMLFQAGLLTTAAKILFMDQQYSRRSALVDLKAPAVVEGAKAPLLNMNLPRFVIVALQPSE